MLWHLRRQPRLHGILREHPLDNDPRCAGCDGACCRGFPSVELTWEEYELLRKRGALRLALPLAGPPLLLIDYGCEFLAGGRCAIYEERPAICRRFTCEDVE
jgi:hypothetical protein